MIRLQIIILALQLMACIDVRTLQEQKRGASILSRQGTAVYPKGQPSTDSSDLEIFGAFIPYIESLQFSG